MGHDPFSPIAPARLKVLLLPVGKIKRSRFLSFVERLEAENVVRLGDVSPDGRPNRNMFSPLAFPTGKVLFDLSLSNVSETHTSLSPFERFREPVAIVGIADGVGRNPSANGVGPVSNTLNGIAHEEHPEPDDNMDDVIASLATLKEQHPHVLVHQAFVFDCMNTARMQGIATIPPPQDSKTTTVKTIMCSLTSLILGEFTEYANHIQGLSNLESPKIGPDDAHEQPPGINRTESFRKQSPQPGSAGLERVSSTEERVMHRMSMPAQPSPKSGETSRQISGVSGKFVATRVPGSSSTFEDGRRTTSPSTRPSAIPASVVETNSTEHSRERVPVQGFGSTSASEKSRNRNKGRAGMIVGALYLQAGRWPDALKTLVESATMARTNSDYLWQAKALENIVVCLLTMAWAGMDFQIPQICYPSVADRISISTAKPPPATSSPGIDGVSHAELGNQSASLRYLANLLPELLNHILNLYTRAANITEEALPQLAFSETVIRFSKLLTACHIRDGYIDEALLNHAVMDEPIIPPGKYDRPRGGAYLRKSDLTSRLFRALPTSTDNTVASRDLSPILVASAFILSKLGLRRKRAFILRELMAILVPALVHARKVGAAKIGIHPAAGLSALDGAGLTLKSVDSKSANLQEGLTAFMNSLGDVYGVVPLDSIKGDKSEMNGSAPGHEDTALKWDSNEAIMIRTLQTSRLRRFGMLVLKVDLLVECVNFCEALPDFQGVLQFTVELLQTLSPGTPLPPDGKELQFLPRDEQIRLISNIKRTVGTGAKLGLMNLEAEYWDDFLVRGVELLEHSQPKRLIPHSKKELQVAEAIQDTLKKNPFIYNPFAKTTSTTEEQLLVSGEHAIFKIDLQNPFEFELEIENVGLETEGVAFESAPQGFVLGPYSMHIVHVAGFAKESGPLKVTGCVIKVKDCRKRRFPIFKNAWSPAPKAKTKLNGLAARHSYIDRLVSTGAEGSQNINAQGSLPKAETFVTTVIEPQPSLVVNSTSLPQSAVMLLEGETKNFSITLLNTSLVTPVDFILFTFRDSTTSKLQSAMNNKDVPPAELYELDLQLSKKTLTWKRDDGELDVFIGPGKTSTLNIEVFGIPGLTEATVQIDYAHLGVSRSDIREKFYTRHLVIPLTITVNASVEMVKWDILPFTGDFAWLNQRKQQFLPNGNIPTPNDPFPRSRAISRVSRQDSSPNAENSQFQSLLDRLGLRNHGNDHCLLLLDLRNAWPSPLDISIQVRDASSLSPSPNASPSPFTDSWRRAYTVHEILQPGHISRLVLLLPRNCLPNLHAPIPALNPSTQRQYVVSATKIPPDQELANREAFWFRAELLKHIRGTWSESTAGTSHEGAIELRGIRLNPRMIDAMRVEDVDISFHLSPSSSSSTSTSNSDDTVQQTARSSFTIRTHTFLTLTVQIHNCSSSPIHPLLRLQPSLRNQPTPFALDLSKRLVWIGMLQRPLPVLGPGETTETRLGLCAMCRGEFEVGGSVEEVRVMKPLVGEGLDALAAKERGTGRRIWHARESCVILARDGGEER